MARKRSSSQIVLTYVLSLVVALSLLVFWVVYVVQSVARVQDFAGRVGMSDPRSHWLVLSIGCLLFFILIVGVTHQLAQALAARRYSRKQEEFVSNITHEMKSPLAAIKLHAQTLLEPNLTEEQRQRSTRLVLEQVERMGKLVDDVLESSRMVDPKHRPELEHLELEPFLDRYFASHRKRIEDEEVELNVRIDTDAVVLASEDALERILNNLLENAARFSEKGGEVRCRIEDIGEEVQIEVEDDGIGIPKKELAKIFDRFYQIGRELGGRRGGTGLGLSIVSSLVRELGGTVSAHSQEGKPGARFVVNLPIVETVESRS
ncbi:MAG: HAMP domain-containing sensor histidine kinase [Thermoanaerobaculia bacterium]|nr:HAMP domain-containing sensor histidine kinase [Thermoanaerobaculia bacterium]